MSLAPIYPTRSTDSLAVVLGHRAEALGKGIGQTLLNLHDDGRVSALVYDEAVAVSIAAASSVHLGMDSGMAPGAIERVDVSDSLIEKSWSDGIDNRIYVGSPDFNFWHQELSRIGTISGALPDHHCSGTLVGNRVVWTAAHCLGFNSNGAFNGVGFFTPQQHGATGPNTGWSGWSPWGTAKIEQAIIPPKWVSGGCIPAQGAAPDCWKYDFAIAILPSNPFPGPLGHPGFTALMWNDGPIGTFDKKQVGYPGCGASPPSPANCLDHQPYGDVFSNCAGLAPIYSGASASNGWPWSANHHPAIDLGCDVSEGHSGGPVYTITGTCSNGPCVFANVSANSWSPYGMQGIKINSTLFNYLIACRNAYP